MNQVRRVIQPVLVPAAVLFGLLLPPVDVSPTATAGLLAAILTIVLVAVVASCAIGIGLPADHRARAALDRLVPRTAQADPDARGHARPRAPGLLLTAV